jgi:TRAP-type C4-dicarboxylate transport system substrate-binding protein
MMMKKVIHILVISLIMAGLVLAFAGPSTAKPIKFKAVTFLRVGEMATNYFLEYAKRVGEQSKGELTIEHVGGPETIPPFAQQRATKTGAVDMALTAPGPWEAVVKESSALHLATVPVHEWRETGFYDWMAELFRKKVGIQYLGGLDVYKPFYFWVNKHVDTPDDLAGLKLASTGIFPRLAQEFGAKSVIVRHSEIYTAMERGVIDGFFQPATAIPGRSLFEVTKYGIRHGVYEAISLQIFVNLDKWNSLPPHLQNLMITVLEDYYPEIEASNRQLDKEGWEALIKGGGQAIEFSPADAKRFRDTAYDYGWKKVKSKVSPESYDKLVELMTK